MAGVPPRHTESYVYTHLGDHAAAEAACDRALGLYPTAMRREAAQVELHRALRLVSDDPVGGAERPAGCARAAGRSAHRGSAGAGPIGDRRRPGAGAPPSAGRRPAGDARATGRRAVVRLGAVAALEIRRHGKNAVPALRDDLVDVHRDARSDLLGQPFYTTERFAERLDNYVTDPTFSLVTGPIDSTMVGYAFGGALAATIRWWSGLQGATDPDVTRETENRTFAFRELLVRKTHQRRGYAHQLHDALLADRHEARATLLLRQDNSARDLYLRWGWTIVGTMQPFPDSPIMEAMILRLH